MKYDYIVVGGSGFIGKNLVSNLISLKKKILVLDLVNPHLNCEYKHCDITNQEILLTKFSKASKVMLLAASHADDCDVEDYYRVNHQGTKNVIKCVNENQISEIIFISSVAVYGKDQDISDINLSPNNDYGKSKLLAEKELELWKNANSSRLLKIIRPTAVFGYGSLGNTNRFFRTVINNRFIFIGNKYKKKSLCYVDNLVNFIIFCDNFENSLKSNYVDKPDLTLFEIVQIINKNKYKKQMFNLAFIDIPFSLFNFVFKFFHYIDLIKYLIKDLSYERINRISSDSVFEGINKDLTFKPNIPITSAIITEVQKYQNDETNSL